MTTAADSVTNKDALKKKADTVEKGVFKSDKGVLTNI